VAFFTFHGSLLTERKLTLVFKDIQYLVTVSVNFTTCAFAQLAHKASKQSTAVIIIN